RQRTMAICPSMYPSLLASPLPRPPGSTLFPYTTLFRSTEKAYLGLTHRYHESHSHADPARPGAEHVTAYLNRLAAERTVSVATQDRKSTRLNSSHVKISYAVPCLKKKKQRRGYAADSVV